MDWVKQVRGLRTDMIGGIAALSDTLGGMQRLMGELVVEMRQVIELQALQGGRIGRFSVLLQEIVAVVSDWERRLHDPSRRLLLDGITGDLAGLSRIRLFFHFLSTITAIQITREKSVELMSFVDDLKSMPEKIEIELARAQTGVENFRKAQEAMARDAAAGAQVLIRAETQLGPVAATLVETERAAEVASTEAARLAHRAMESAEAAVVRLIKAFQFSDSAAQRLEHVEAILKSGAPGSAHAQLAAAQLQALSDDLSDVTRELGDGLGAIGQLGRSVLDGFAPSQEEMRKMLDSQGAIEGLFKAATETARPAMERISGQCERLTVEITEVLQRLEALDDIGQAISLAAVNARVKAAHAALAKQELGYIAMAVNESASQAVDTIAVAVKGMGQLRTQLDAMDYPGMATKLSEMTQVVDVIQATLAAAATREAEMAAVERSITQTLDNLDAMTVSSQERLSHLPRLSGALAEAARDIRQGDVVRVDPGALSGLLPLYTMAREREVHARFTGEAVPEEAAAEDLESILF